MWNDPEVFGGFLLVRRMAQSSMASVYLAVRLGDASGRTLVLKRPPLGERPSGRPAQALLREAEVLGAVRGPGIPALEAAGEIAGLPYVGLERLRGASLARVVALGGPLPFAAVRAIGKDVARALATLHAAGWVHRDVTPSNVLIDDAGEAYLLDFGLCERAGASSAPVAGTRGYAAPEAPTAQAAAAAQDVYGLAVCLAEAALGRRLFEEASLVEAAGRGDAPRAAAGLEGDLPGLSAALRRDPSARPSAESFASGLGEAGERDTLAALAERGTVPEPSVSEPGLTPPPPSVAAVDSASRPTPAMPSPVAAAFGPPPAGMVAPPSAVTPTISMPLLTLRDAPAREVAVREVPPSEGRARSQVAAPREARRGLPLWAALLALVVVLAIGFVSGRFSLRAGRGASFSIAGPLPKRAEIFLDDKKLTVADGVPMSVPPGAHTLTIATAKSGKRDIAFTVRPGEHVVILSSARAGGTSAPDDDVAP